MYTFFLKLFWYILQARHINDSEKSKLSAQILNCSSNDAAVAGLEEASEDKACDKGLKIDGIAILWLIDLL